VIILQIPAKINHANLLFVYDNVIKTPDAVILKLAAGKYAKRLEDFMHLELPESTTFDTLTQRLVKRTVKNPIEWLAKKEFDYDKTYNQLKAKSIRLYEDSIYLNSFNSIRIFLKSYCIGKIYIWNDTNDMRQLYDISGLLELKDDKVQYVVSPTLRQAIDSIGNVNVVYDWDIDRVNEIVSTGLYDNILFAVANYPFNFEIDNMNKFKYNLSETENVRPFNVLDKEELFYG
jgi:hypothetical protein